MRAIERIMESIANSQMRSKTTKSQFQDNSLQLKSDYNKKRLTWDQFCGVLQKAFSEYSNLSWAQLKHRKGGNAHEA